MEQHFSIGYLRNIGETYYISEMFRKFLETFQNLKGMIRSQKGGCHKGGYRGLGRGWQIPQCERQEQSKREIKKKYFPS